MKAYLQVAFSAYFWKVDEHLLERILITLNLINLYKTDESVNESFSQTYRAQLRTNFRTAPNVDLSYRYSIQDNNLGSERH